MALDADAARTLRAAAAVYVPGPPDDDTAGAAEIEADRFIAHYLDYLLPGLAAHVPSLLDQATEIIGEETGFADASLEERRRALASFATHEIPQLRELPRIIATLTLGAVYGAWTGQDADGRVIRAPIGWQQTGYDGPSRGRRRLLDR